MTKNNFLATNADPKTIETLLTSDSNPDSIKIKDNKKYPTRYPARNGSLIRSLWFRITEGKINGYRIAIGE